ncbi:MAG: acyl-phosphate glycerol 3-phosphate acyltransferase [Desulfobacterales bacterium]|jgi:1-acyl-sn-glycerol-3-phosphate acyltransferase|nr:acyl-phosphate glycerol 3-phosphate acyltransferase [Desulfobacteraceae bacterium]MBT4364942.1 acyl-phosphate glycerol 3-phosphate acyltransferase [Desulfobacteraceae bacterium]MBT7085733.1 acyl-phosphate glycerol 3-phosphate acyltransferase [Desulfobacterales bacterium]MBT7696176.1 acyl-phosphate glycerol 3-phosphate acyltransferase [Desulfobacterales bacterium]
MKTFLSVFCKLLYKMMGWTYEDLPPEWTNKRVVIGFPHTSNMDTIRAFAYIKIAKLDVKLMIKAEWFFWPVSVFLRSLGGIPVAREKGAGTVGQIIQNFNEMDEFILALVPEGTRKKVKKVKTGFWTIAKKANVPITCWYLDNKAKKTRWVGSIIPGESIEDDLIKINRLYKKFEYTLPGMKAEP